MPISENDLRLRLGEKIEELRSSKNLGVREFALIAEIEHHQLINIEKGRVDLRLKTLRKIAIGLDIEVQELFNFKKIS
ncbi:helix-turn-helix domain-containing protein [Mucilaginibacter sp. RCC_168]|uniref:helix-turn-helix domain-containing protein n=1 Tax=unclassified Mucilaginibacter TaxID=2617802 RepID=UPI00087F733C|nr:helix-turn-helix transcriptional regulator [Mucilaginibacter sp. OK268]SDP12840.1 DNA-binding transcriptional regulator, XRE-family HTH domain [Mucilaginibacter sp. OK268]